MTDVEKFRRDGDRAGAGNDPQHRADLARCAPQQLPMALARLHLTLPVGALVRLRLPRVTPAGTVATPWPDLTDLVVGAGFANADDGDRPDRGQPHRDDARARIATHPMTVELPVRRTWSLADRVGPGMRLLVCGLNPSPYAADHGIAFGRPGNRFWPALLSAGLARVDRDPDAALTGHGIGFTDLVKRTTRTAAELDATEYRAGAERLERLVGWLEPGVVCFLGLSGYRAAIDRRAVAGVLPGGFAGRPAVLLGNPSGLNAHLTPTRLAADLAAAATLAGPVPARSPAVHLPTVPDSA